MSLFNKYQLKAEQSAEERREREKQQQEELILSFIGRFRKRMHELSIKN
jgi:hypothetical protein